MLQFCGNHCSPVGPYGDAAGQQVPAPQFRNILYQFANGQFSLSHLRVNGSRDPLVLSKFLVHHFQFFFGFSRLTAAGVRGGQQ